MSTTGSHHFSSPLLSAEVSADGAELIRLRTADGQDLLWNAGKEWKRHAPILFPIVGRLKNDRAEIDGRTYKLTQHGFARDRAFTWIEKNPDGCILELAEDPQTLKLWPFRFRLRIEYRLSGARLSVITTIINPDPQTVMHVSLGAHPAFRWLSEPGTRQTDYTLTFEKPEPAPIRRVKDGLLAETGFPTPVSGKILHLTPDLFRDDALILDSLNSSALTFGRPGHPGLHISWEGYRELGIWTKPGAGFLCIEPWYGYASPETFSGPFEEKPGLLHLPPGESWRAAWYVALTDA
ncbi:aldose 1-epimerase family protein [Acetobacter sp. AN02]|uniref:aldose 1-epimerase family protein n=1 Tax=Acetobacter sp. AN02 TaxID=2894186 RepID=UPI0024340E48|nr:aldose 1-epimerase family protein [Acetobacter sp. AN02]MDG6093759.1 aldose 1-epimerase family protein [Acetobacter sp. AN02]